jgi:hypothetical protein
MPLSIGDGKSLLNWVDEATGFTDRCDLWSKIALRGTGGSLVFPLRSIEAFLLLPRSCQIGCPPQNIATGDRTAITPTAQFDYLEEQEMRAALDAQTTRLLPGALGVLAK